ncbi:hypothetical protein [Candidatus Nitrospira nitrificans]|uniref:Lipoprotein n=1 Tax=Candidatus Nitrospira nitrificans TaxID=1742973 RepID=A0A0S4LCT9_9BACT|nr:hypothetical protein [Candidatus Nitrospira nitrificans]CUS34670.1 hypothetical protein COMA2_180020 [Candidatus Nitrospira nitrificans]
MTIQFSRIFLMVMIGIGCLDLGTRSEAATTPCSLLTDAEIEQIVGKLVGTPRAGEEGRAVWCNYEFTNGKDAMEVWIFPADGIERARKEAKKPAPLKGLGEDAFVERGRHGLDYVDLFIRKGKTTIQLSLKETAGDEEKLKTLGRKAVDRL